MGNIRSSSRGLGKLSERKEQTMLTNSLLSLPTDQQHHTGQTTKGLQNQRGCLTLACRKKPIGHLHQSSHTVWCSSSAARRPKATAAARATCVPRCRLPRHAGARSQQRGTCTFLRIKYGFLRKDLTPLHKRNPPWNIKAASEI